MDSKSKNKLQKGESLGEKPGILPQGQYIRINKYIAMSGICSRRQADELIRNGHVKINGKKAELGDQVDGSEKIQVHGKAVVKVEEKIYIAFHKPYGVICTTDPNATNNIVDYLGLPGRIFPTGKLEVEASGLVLLTNNGEVVNTLSQLQNRYEKEYFVTLHKAVTDESLQQLRDGVTITEGKTEPATVVRIAPNQFSITIKEGMNRQIYKMCEAIRQEVKILKRTRIHTINLGELARGKWRNLSGEEINDLIPDVKS